MERFPGEAGETACMVKHSLSKCKDLSSSLGTGIKAGHGGLGLDSQHQEGRNSSSPRASSPSNLAAQLSSGSSERLSQELRCRNDCRGYIKLTSGSTHAPIAMVCLCSAQGLALFRGVALME